MANDEGNPKVEMPKHKGAAPSLRAVIGYVLTFVIEVSFASRYSLYPRTRPVSFKQFSETLADSEEADEDCQQELLETHAELVADRLFSAFSHRLDPSPRKRRRSN